MGIIQLKYTDRAGRMSHSYSTAYLQKTEELSSASKNPPGAGLGGTCLSTVSKRSWSVGVRSQRITKSAKLVCAVVNKPWFSKKVEDED